MNDKLKEAREKRGWTIGQTALFRKTSEELGFEEDKGEQTNT